MELLNYCILQVTQVVDIRIFTIHCLFNCSRQMKVRSGEKFLDRMDFVEDTKGNGGDKGRLVVTNLRVMWHSLTIARISLC